MHDGGGAIGGGAPTPHFDHTPHISHTPHVDHVSHHHMPASDNWGPASSADPQWAEHDAFGQSGVSRPRTRAQMLLSLLALILIFVLVLGFAIG